MNQKTTFGLILALGVAIAGLWWAQSSSSKSNTKITAGPKLLIEPPLEEIKDAEISPAQGAAAIKFVKEDEKWKMSAPVSGPAEQTAVTADINKIKDLKYSRVFSKDDAERPTDQMTSLNKPLKVVKLTDKSGKSATIKVGSRQALSSGTYVQKDGDDAIYLASDDVNAEMKKSINDYRGKRVTEFVPTDANRIELTGEQQYTASKNNNQWTLDAPIKGRADMAAVNRILNAASNMSAMKYVEDSPANLRPYGLDPPRLVVTINTETRTPKPQAAPLASAPAEPQFDVKQHVYKIAFGGTADDKVFARMLEPPINSVFQLASSALKDVSPNLEDLRDKTLLDLQMRQPQSITYSGGGQTVKLAKSAGAQWEVTTNNETKPAEPSAVDDLIKALKGLKAMGFETAQSPAQGLDAPRSTIELVVEGQLQPIKLSVGGLTPSKTGAYIKNETDGTIAVVSAKNGDDLSVGPMSFLGRELLKFANARASALAIEKPGAKISLARQSGAWKMTSPIAGDAEDAHVQSILADLSNLRGRRVVGSAADAAKYGLNSAAIKVVVTEDAPAPPQTTQPTSQPALPPTNYTLLLSKKDNLTYAMVAGGDKIVEVDAKVYDDVDAELLKTMIAQVEPSQVSKLGMTGEAEFTFEKNGETWRLTGEETFAVDPAKITELLSAIRDMRAKKYVEYSGADLARYGLNKPLRTITWQTPEGVSTTLMLAATGPSPAEAYATISTAPDRVLVIKIEDLMKLKKKVQDFQKAGS